MSGVFRRVLCAVDDSDAGVVAARIAARVTERDGVLTLVAVDDTSTTIVGGLAPVGVAPPEPKAGPALRAAVAEAEPLHGLWTRSLQGDPARTILEQAEERRASLLVIGTHGYRRSIGVAFGLVGSRLLHDAGCSVLVAHSERSEERWPRSIVVGVDGSLESAVAADTGRDLADRFHASLRLVACAGGHADLEAARAVGPEVEVLPSRPVDALHVLSDVADVVVVGSRGLHGIRAIGSVSERVAHRSRCSVLVVRPPASGG
jgi:nucleotide-binding universal stress UspA family protein